MTPQEGFLSVTLLLSLAGLRLDWHKQDGWLQEVRSLGTPRFPVTRLDAWLVQEGAQESPPPPAGAASPGQAPLQTPSSARAGQSPSSAPAGRQEENDRSTIESTLPLEGYFPLPPLLTENILEEHLEHLTPINNEDVNFSNHESTVDWAHAISHNVSLQDAMMGADHTAAVNAERSHLEIQNTTLLNSSLTSSDTSLINATNLMGIFASDNECRNLTNQDFLMCMDGNRFDEINITSLAVEENFDPMEASSLFEVPDSRTSLNLDRGNSSFALTCDSDAESTSSNILGAVGGYCGEYKYCHMDYEHSYDLSSKSLVDVFHNHTYNQTPPHLAPSVSEDCHAWPEKSNRDRRNVDRNQNHGQAKAVSIPFSVNDIVSLPVDSFNTMLSRHYLTDNQLSLIRDIRRRGKNKVAAQNCRRRKLDAIMNLEDDVCHLQAKKESLKKEKAQCSRAITLIKQKLDALSWNIFSRLRDDQGGPVNPDQYTLHCCKNGSVLVVPGTEVKLESKQTPQNKK